MDAIVYVIWPPLVACAALAIWKVAYVGRRPLSRGVKAIVVGILIWSMLPLVGWLGIMWLAAMGGHFGD